MVLTLDLSDGFRVVDGDESVRLRVEQHLRFVLGEWALDQSAGVNYWGFVGQSGDVNQIGRYLASEAAQIQDVLDVTVRRVMQGADGGLTLDFTIRTVHGTTITALTTIGALAR